ncbi:hypothetical protein U9M48_003988 [Paspalum notatum var. saurae]|uniref:Uncharacterized protein n=1 Tax=Paspalum notatum var. saurae TaxID=547442 RepID=A0AAQ3PJ91_PASNO
MANLNPLFKMPCRTTARNVCMRAFQEKKTELNDITPHNGIELFNQINNCIQDWSTEDKLFGTTQDNAAANNTMVDLLKQKLMSKKYLPPDVDLLHHQCAAHVFNLIVKNVLKFVKPTVVNICESVKYIRSSQSRKQTLKEIVA